jgi:hypothetical protein
LIFIYDKRTAVRRHIPTLPLELSCTDYAAKTARYSSGCCVTSIYPARQTAGAEPGRFTTLISLRMSRARDYTVCSENIRCIHNLKNSAIMSDSLVYFEASH